MQEKRTRRLFWTISAHARDEVVQEVVGRDVNRDYGGGLRRRPVPVVHGQPAEQRQRERLRCEDARIVS